MVWPRQRLLDRPPILATSSRASRTRSTSPIHKSRTSLSISFFDHLHFGRHGLGGRRTRELRLDEFLQPLTFRSCCFSNRVVWTRRRRVDFLVACHFSARKSPIRVAWFEPDVAFALALSRAMYWPDQRSTTDPRRSAQIGVSIAGRRRRWRPGSRSMSATAAAKAFDGP